MARLVGPYSDVVMIHEWEGGDAFTVSIVWIDPSNSVAASFDTKVRLAIQLAWGLDVKACWLTVKNVIQFFLRRFRKA